MKPTRLPSRRAGEHGVPARTAGFVFSTLARGAALLSAVVASGGCVEINGGAVEVSWAIFARDGRAITDCSCVDPQIGFVRLQLVSESDPTNLPCAGNNACRFSCGRKTGATPFIIPPGQYLMSVVPLDAAGVDLPTTQTPGAAWVQTPPAESRTVVRGQPTELEAFMLEADCLGVVMRPGTSRTCNGGGIFSSCSGG